MRQKGFTLFTALVSFVLIVLAVLLIQSMIRAERNTTDVISDIREQEEMQAIADLARADAFQIFNFGIRHQIERHITRDGDPNDTSNLPDGIPDNEYLLGTDVTTWQEIQNDFAQKMFGGSAGGRQFATITAKRLTILLTRSDNVREYDVSLTESNETLLRNTLQETFEESTLTGEFFKLIKCPDGDYDNCLGTFYINLNLADLSDEAYESFPQIQVKNRQTGRTLKQPILPRGKLQIYIPLRMFKAIAGAWEIARGNGGLFTDGTRELIDDMKIGLCDTGSCDPRTEANTPTIGELPGFSCPGDSINTANRPDSVPVGGYSYNPNSHSSMTSTIKLLVEDKVNESINAVAPTVGVLSDDSFKLQASGGNLAKKVLAGTKSRQSKNIQMETATTNNNNNNGNNSNNRGTINDAGSAYCAEANDMRATIVFREMNPKYMVIERPAGSSMRNMYAVRLYDNRYTTYSNAIDKCVTMITNTPATAGGTPGKEYDCEPRA